MTDIDIEWGDPPPSTRGRSGLHAPIVEALKTRPGQWAHVRQAVTASMASQSVQVLKRLGCEATQRNDKTAGTTDVWARWPEGEATSDD